MDGKTRFNRLSESAKIGEMILKNRMIMGPMGSAFSNEAGLVTEEMKHYYEARAKGGAGMVIVENACVDFPRGRHRVAGLSIDGEGTIQGLSQLAQLIKKHGARAAIQLHHAGRIANSKVNGLLPIAPSAIPTPGGEIPHEPSIKEIHSLVSRYADAAKLAKRAGFEGVEIHGAHHYLIAEFLSHAFNKRHDQYGGSIENRAKLLLEVIEAVREAVGDEFPVWCRINARELGVENGLSLEEGLEIAKMVNRTSVDAISVSAFGYGEFYLYMFPEIPGALIPLAAAVKQVVNKPVMGVGMITPEIGEQGLEDGIIDFVVLGRGIITDPEYPNKVISGRVEEIRPCIHCFVCRDSRYSGGSSLRCSVNAAVGREKKYAIKPVDKAKDVLVIGGGPSGMEAARVAAIRGHRVALYEKEDRLGGQLLFASVPPHKSSLNELCNYYLTQIRNLGVKVELGKEATPESVREAKADAVIIATGILSMLPKLPPMEKNKVVLAQQVLAGEVEVGEKVVIIGGGMVGCETAEFLEEKGRKVTIVEMLDEIAANMRPTPRDKLVKRIAQKPINILTGAKYEKVTEEGLVITDKGENLRTIQFDTIIFATGAKPNTELFNSLKGVISNLHQAGDCIEPRGIMEAIEEGIQSALKI